MDFIGSNPERRTMFPNFVLSPVQYGSGSELIKEENVSVGKELWQTQDVFLAACFIYLYGKEVLAQIKDIDISSSNRRLTSYSLAVPSEDARILVEEYHGNRLALSSAKDFVAAFNSVTQQHKGMRQRGESSWCSEAWQRGEVG
jgi:hypothetical protein